MVFWAYKFCDMSFKKCVFRVEGVSGGEKIMSWEFFFGRRVCYGLRENLSFTVVPWSGVLSIFIEPLLICVSRWACARPIPRLLPACFWEKNGMVAFWSVWVSIPRPWSVISNSTVSG